MIIEDEEREAGFSFGDSFLWLHQKFLITFGRAKPASRDLW
jgi:hypothetical protein